MQWRGAPRCRPAGHLICAACRRDLPVNRYGWFIVSHGSARLEICSRQPAGIVLHYSRPVVRRAPFFFVGARSEVRSCTSAGTALLSSRLRSSRPHVGTGCQSFCAVCRRDLQTHRYVLLNVSHAAYSCCTCESFYPLCEKNAVVMRSSNAQLSSANTAVDICCARVYSVWTGSILPML